MTLQLSNFQTIKQIHQGLVRRDFSASELTQAYLGRIKEEDKKIGAFLEISEALALSQAAAIDKMISNGEEIFLLSGIPLAIKDNILVKGLRATAGSKILENYLAPFDATVIKKLKANGAVFLGKTNLDEFAMGGSTENSAFKKTYNPCDLSRVPGGSSGGSAAAVAANECVYALGSDTGGSIRQPASFCGVVGLKPTYGRVSRYGLIAFASSLDQIGPLTKTVEDAEIVFSVIAGKDEYDSTSVDLTEIEGSFSSFHQFPGIKIGVPQEYFGEGIELEVKEAIERAIKKAEEMGAKIEDISLPHTKYALAVYYLIATSEASANLSRYDGIKYGLSYSSGTALADVYFKTRGAGFGSEVKRRIMLGTYALSAGYYDAYYLKAQKVRNLIKLDFEKAFQKVDVIFTPTSPILPFKIGEKINDPLQIYLADFFTVSVSLAGLPAISLPVGRVKNLPVGLQIIGKPFQEKEIFEVGKVMEGLFSSA